MGKKGALSVTCNNSDCNYTAITSKPRNSLKDKTCPYCKKGTMKEVR